MNDALIVNPYSLKGDNNSDLLVHEDVFSHQYWLVNLLRNEKHVA